MKNKYDIVIVGGGPAGTTAARIAAELGVSVCLLEKDREIGIPVRCGEAVGEKGLLQFIEPRDHWIAATITHFGLVSPNGTRINSMFKDQHGYILNRKNFDFDLSCLAAQAGADIFTRSYVYDLLFENGSVTGVKLEYRGEQREIRAKIVIGADGVESMVGRWAGLQTNIKMKDIESCAQYTVGNIDIDVNRIDFYVGSVYAPGGYVWVFPKGNGSANIGLGINGSYCREHSAIDYLNKFVEEKYPQVSILAEVCGGDPCAKPIKKPVTNGLILIGDAAHQVNPMTGGGIISGMKAGVIGAQVCAESIKIGDYSERFLQKYVMNMMKDFGNAHNKFYRIQQTITKLTDQEFDNIAGQVANIPESDRTLTKIFKACVYKKPSLMLDVIKVFAGI